MAPLNAFSLSQDRKDSTNNVQQNLLLSSINLLEGNFITDSSIETYDGVITASNRYALGGQIRTALALSCSIN